MHISLWALKLDFPCMFMFSCSFNVIKQECEQADVDNRSTSHHLSRNYEQPSGKKNITSVFDLLFPVGGLGTF